jgi:hypothetical protein
MGLFGNASKKRCFSQQQRGRTCFSQNCAALRMPHLSRTGKNGQNPFRRNYANLFSLESSRWVPQVREANLGLFPYSGGICFSPSSGRRQERSVRCWSSLWPIPVYELVKVRLCLTAKLPSERYSRRLLSQISEMGVPAGADKSPAPELGFLDHCKPSLHKLFPGWPTKLYSPS